jgi:hypothetical protein
MATAEPPRTIQPAGPITAGGDLAAMLRSLHIEDDAPARPGAVADKGSLTMLGAGRGAAMMYFDDFSSYPRSTDPIFDRFQVNMQDQSNPEGGFWDFSQGWYIPTLCVDGQFDNSEPPLPDLLPRWQGAELVENQSIGVLFGDVNGDDVVDSADLGALITRFLTPRPGAAGPDQDLWDGADLNDDLVIDTADLGAVIGNFGNSASDITCLYSVVLTHSVDPDGIPLAGGTIAAGPVATQTIAVLNTGALSNDVDADMDGCPDCGAFSITTDGAVSGERVYGDWTLTDPAYTGPADFMAEIVSVTCTGWGDEECLCDARDEAQISENACCFLGARVNFPPFAALVGEPVIADIDVFLTDINTFQWLDWTSATEGFAMTAGRVFLGGYAPSLTPDFLSFANEQGYMNHFVFLGTDGNGAGHFYSTVERPLLGIVGIEIKAGEWFTLRLVLKTDELQFWVNDSETRALVDPAPGDNGDSTPLDASDDIEDGFAKVFPSGPFGSTTGAGPFPDLPQIPQPILAATSIDTVRLLWGGDPTSPPYPDFTPHTACYDNFLVTGVPLITPTPPPLTLPYTDDIEAYNTGGTLGLQGGRWFDLGQNHAIIDDTIALSGSQSITEFSSYPDGSFRTEFGTALPLASANSAPWTAGVSVSLSGVPVVRSIAINDNTFGIDPFDPTVARLLTGVEDETGNVVVDGSGHSTIHLRVRNPNYDPDTEPDDSAQPDASPEIPPVNSQWLNVPTDAKWTDTGTFHHFTFGVDAEQNLVIARDGAPINPDPVSAPLAGYTASGWSAGSVAVDEMAFGSGNQLFGIGESISVDDVTLVGVDRVIATGPPQSLPYAEGFEDYQSNAPIDGQDDGRYDGGGNNILVLDDPTVSGRGNVLRAINNNGFNADGGSLYIDLRSSYPDSYALVGGPDCVLEFDCYVTDNKSRYTIDVSGPNGRVTEIQLGGPDKNFFYFSPGGLEVPATNFSFLEKNPTPCAPFSCPSPWFYDTGTPVPLNAWFRLRISVHTNITMNNSYTVAMDASGIPGGDGVFEFTIDTNSGEETGGPSAKSGEPVDQSANVIDGFDTNAGHDIEGDGTFLRDPIEITQDDATLPGALVFPSDFCFYRIDDIDGSVLGVPPAPCNGVFSAGDILGLARNAALPGWPNGGVAANSPTSPRFIWNDDAMTGQCLGQWTRLDPEDLATGPDFPANPGEVASWADYTLIPPYANPGPASRWYFDNITLDGSPTP